MSGDDIDILMTEISQCLHGKPPMTAGELAFLLAEEVPEVRRALGAMVREGSMQRHHLSDGTLRYSLRTLAEVESPAATAASPAPAMPQPSQLSFGVSLDIQVDSAIREIDAIALCPDVAARAAALYSVHRVLNAHMERTALAIVVSESTPVSPS